MKICMVSNSEYYDSRPNRYALSLIEKGHSVDMICLGDRNHSRYEIINGIHTYLIQTRQYDKKSPLSYLKNLIFFFFQSAFICTKLHLEKRYDIIHFHNIPDFGVFCTLVPKLMGAKVILDIHDVVPEFYMRKFSVPEKNVVIRLLKWIEKVSSSYADHVITVTDIWRDRLIERSVSPSKCSVILNAPHGKLFMPIKKSKQNNGVFTLSYHGNLKEPTGIDVAIRAVGIAKKTIPSIRFQIIGGNGSADKNLKKLIGDLRITKNVRLMKAISVEKISGFIGLADVGIDPKQGGVYAGETLSVKAMEYIAMQIPLIASRTMASQTYFNDSMVMFFEPGDEK
ncbi:MAG: glycosyltransferase, partial [bacterium]